MDTEPEIGQRDRRFLQLYTPVQRRLYGYVLALVPDFAAVEDIVQETVLVMWREFDTFEPGTDFAAWAMAIARNRVFAYIKTRQRDQGRRLSVEALQAVAQTAESRIEAQDDRFRALQECLQKLSSRDAQLLALRYEVGATLKAVCARTGQSLNTLYNRLYKIRIALLQCIETQLAERNR